MMAKRYGSAVTLSGMGQVFAMGALLATLLGVSYQNAGGIQAYFQKGNVAAKAASGVARRIIVYRLDNQSPTIFRFSNPARTVRIVTQPTLTMTKTLPGEKWPYAISAELIGADGKVISAHDVYSQAILLDASGKMKGPERYFRGSNLAVALSDEVTIAANKPAVALRIKRVGSSKEIAAVHVRVYEIRPVIGTVAETAFLRLSPDEQAQAVRGNAFPAAYLTRDERVNLAINQWRPIGPQGIVGRDYTMQVLYQKAEEDSE
jgi:hypothetical protein